MLQGWLRKKKKTLFKENKEEYSSFHFIKQAEPVPLFSAPGALVS